MSTRFQLAGRLNRGGFFASGSTGWGGGTIETAARLALNVYPREAVMPVKTVLASLCILFLALSFTSCDKDYRQIVVVDGGKAELVTYGVAPKKTQEMWVPGRTLAFRTDSPLPGAPSKLANALGKAGHVYRLGQDLALEEVAEFQPTVPNDTLAYTFGN
jgi:hypothetical protein